MDASRTIGSSAARLGRHDIHFYVARPPNVVLNIIGSIVFMSIRSAAIFFMLTVLCALISEARSHRIRLINKDEVPSVTPVSIERRFPRMDRAT
jgi:hypothetical protein